MSGKETGKKKVEKGFAGWTVRIIVILLVTTFALTRGSAENAKALSEMDKLDVYRMEIALRAQYYESWKRETQGGGNEEFLEDLRNGQYKSSADDVRKYIERFQEEETSQNAGMLAKLKYRAGDGPLQLGTLTSFLFHNDPITFLLAIILFWMIGSALESVAGHYITLVLVVVGGILSNVIAGFCAPSSQTEIAGIYGSVWLMGGSMLIVKPWLPIRVNFEIPSFVLVLLWALLSIIFGMFGGSLEITGGFVAGAAATVIGIGAGFAVKPMLPEAPVKAGRPDKKKKKSRKGPVVEDIDREQLSRLDEQRMNQKQADEKKKTEIKDLVENESFDEALEIIGKELSDAPNDEDLHDIKIEIFEKTDRKEDADRVRVVLMSIMVRRMGDYGSEERAIILYREIEPAKSLPDDINDAFLLVKVLVRAEMYAEAVMTGNMLVRKWPKEELAPKVLSYLANIHSQKLEDADAARTVYRILAKYYPDTADADFAIRELKRFEKQSEADSEEDDEQEEDTDDFGDD